MISRFPLSVLVITAAAIWALVLSGNGWIIPVSFFLPLSIVIGALSVLLLVFERWVWAWPGFRLFTNRPDLRGTWKGVIRSNWKDDERGTGLGLFHAYVTIHQTYTGVHLRLFTRESQSVTTTATLVCEPDEHHVLSGLYRNVPRQLLRSRSPIHHGGLILNIAGLKRDHMSGSYWTDRQTFGEVELRRVSKKRFSDFQTAEEAFS
jgi:hypothetical protein